MFRALVTATGVCQSTLFYKGREVVVRLVSVLIVVSALGSAVLPLAAQVPTPAEAQRLLQTREGAEVIRRRIVQSGLTADQIRVRLQAAGYPTSLLDSYLRAAEGQARTPGDSVVAAMTILGFGTATDLQRFADSLRVSLLSPEVLDSLRADSLAREEKERELKLFGLDVFRRSTTQFLPTLAGPVDANYRLGPGDVLVLILTGDVELAHELEITREGFIVIPQVGQLSVANLTLEGLRVRLRGRLGRVYSGVRTGTTRFDITVARVRMIQVYVVGEVVRPGSYQIPSVSTVLTALYEAGGPTERGNFRSVVVRRGSAVVDTLDLYDYLLRGETVADVRLQTGDVLFVPIHGTRVTIAGAVRRPAVYELRAEETLRDLVEAAGGFRPDAALQRVSISRIVPPDQRLADGPDRMLLDVPIGEIRDGMAPPIEIRGGDSVTVFEVPQLWRSFVVLKGAVYDTGSYGWRPGLRLSGLIELAGGFRPAVYAGRAHVERLNPADSTRYLLTVPLPEDSTQPYPDDILLDDYDIVTIYGRPEFRQERYVTISGMVNDPGRFPYSSGMTLRDLVLMARGLRDGAYLDSAEIGRLPAERSNGQLATILRVPLDSTYLFERDSTTYPRLPGLPGPAGGAPEVLLDPFDQATILRQPNFELQRSAQVTGEVRFPGRYVLRDKAERVSDLVARAGGLVPTAYAAGARFIRRLDDAGRVNLDLERALRDPRGDKDIVLQPGDSLDIPEFIPTVRVVGAVVSPTSVLYQAGEGLGYYIANAGGYAREADKGRVSVRYANGSARTKSRFLFFSSSPKPGPGSTVFVPSKEPGEGFNVAAFMASVAQILASTVAIIVVATR